MISDSHPLKRLQQIILDPIDKWMILAMLIIYVMSLFLLYSADGQEFVQLEKKTLHTFIGFLLLWGLARIKPQILASLALPAYIGGVVLLVAVELFGVTVNGSTVSATANSSYADNAVANWAVQQIKDMKSGLAVTPLTVTVTGTNPNSGQAPPDATLKIGRAHV